MKKNLITIVMTGFMALSLASCKKNYECHCDKKGGGEEHFDIKDTKSKAETTCQDMGENSAVFSSCNLE